MEAAVIKQIMKEVFEEERESFWVPAEEHYRDHEMLKSCREHGDEMRKNHEFVSGVRSTTKTVKRASIFSVIGTLIAAFFAWIVWSFKTIN